MESIEIMEKGIRERRISDYEKVGYGRMAVIRKDSNAFVGWAGLKYLPEFDRCMNDLGMAGMQIFANVDGKNIDEPEYGVPDEENPEWTDEDWLWAVRHADFGSHVAVHNFLIRRREILEAAEAAGIPRAAFLELEPNKPGFEDRVKQAFNTFLHGPVLAAE